MKTSKQIAADLSVVEMRVQTLRRELERAPDIMPVESARVVANDLDGLERVLNAAKVDVVEHKRAGLKARAADA